MTEHEPAKSAMTDGLTLSPSLDLVVESAQIPRESTLVDRRCLWISGLAMILGFVAALVARLLLMLIALITNFAFFGKFSLHESIPADAVGDLGLWVIPIPIIGALIIGVMARYGSKAIRGHGIPEAMEQVLTNESRIPARITFLKPISSAISIGTGGPFGAEGPIIATGGALGSLVGQLLRMSAAERKVLLAGGAAAGMAATFGSPLSAVLLAIELLLFEFRPRSIIPVALAAVVATGTRMSFEGMKPVFAMPDLAQPPSTALVVYCLLGALMGVAAVAVTRIVYGIEDLFERLPIHWMWWPAIGGLVVGLVGYIAPDTMGVGYYNITDVLSNKLAVPAILFLCMMKFLSWSIALGSGTSGGTLAPLFTLGGSMGAVIGILLSEGFPALGVDARIAALVGMASLFAGASRAMLASVVFAFETTLQPVGLLPLLGGCTAAYLVSSLMMRNSIMTEKIVRRGVRAPNEYAADVLDQILVREIASKNVVSLHAEDNVTKVRHWLETQRQDTQHQGYPVLDQREILIGVLTRRELFSTSAKPDQTLVTLLSGSPKFVYDDCTVRQAVDHMANHNIGRLPVVCRDQSNKVVGIVTRSDIIDVFRSHLTQHHPQEPSIQVKLPGRNPSSNLTKPR